MKAASPKEAAPVVAFSQGKALKVAVFRSSHARCRPAASKTAERAMVVPGFP